MTSGTTRRAGRRLAGAAAALGLAALAASCSVEPAPPFQVTGKGSIAGFVFFDKNQDGIFDPSVGDTIIPNLHLIVQSRGTSTTLTGGDLHTDATGQFSVSGIPAGTQQISIDTTGLGSSLAFCTNPLPVTVYINETQVVSVNGQGGCVISIAAAEASSQGTHITIKGTVTSTVNQISTGQAYIEDGSGGIQLFSPTGPTFQIGDVIQVSGTLSTFSNELEVTSPQVATVTAGMALNPSDATVAAINAAATPTANLQGRLLRIRAGKLVDVFTTGAGRNAQITDSTGTMTVRFDSHVVADTTTLKTTFTAGHCYDWTGILKAFTNPALEFFPRSLTDVTEVPCPQ